MYNNASSLFLKKSTFYFLLAGTIIMIVLMILSGKELKTTATPMGIVDLELASSKEAVQTIMLAWKNTGNDVIAKARINTYLDFLFLIFYTLFFYSCCQLLATSFSNKKKWVFIHRCIGAFALLAGLLDVVENIGMLVSLSGIHSDKVAMFTCVAAYLKWLLVLATILLILLALLIKIVGNKIKTGYN